MATIDLPGFFLKTKNDEDDDPIIVKIMGATDLLILESDKAKWRKHLRREGSK